MSGFDEVSEAVRVEAAVWRSFSERVEVVRDRVRDLTLDYSSFFAGELTTLGIAGSVLLVDGYETFRQDVEGLLDGAVREFEQVSGALAKIAYHYDAEADDPRFDPGRFRLPLDEIFG